MPGLRLWIDATSVSGDMSSELEAAEPPTADGPIVELRAKTVSGDVQIVRALARTRRTGSAAPPPGFPQPLGRPDDLGLRRPDHDDRAASGRGRHPRRRPASRSACSPPPGGCRTSCCRSASASGSTAAASKRRVLVWADVFRALDARDDPARLRLRRADVRAAPRRRARRRLADGRLRPGLLDLPAAASCRARTSSRRRGG